MSHEQQDPDIGHVMSHEQEDCNGEIVW